MRVKRTLAAACVAAAPAAVMLAAAMANGPVLGAREGDAHGTRHEQHFDGQEIFRYDTFGDEQLWTNVLHMEQVVPTVSPATALSVGLKVDVDALPDAVVSALRAGAVNLDDPAVTIALLQLNAVVGLRGTVTRRAR